MTLILQRDTPPKKKKRKIAKASMQFLLFLPYYCLTLRLYGKQEQVTSTAGNAEKSRLGKGPLGNLKSPPEEKAHLSLI